MTATTTYYVSEPTDAGIIPPEYRTSFPGATINQASSTSVSQLQNSLQSINSESLSSDKKSHQWSTNPVEEWAKEQVCNRNLYHNYSVIPIGGGVPI